MCHKPFAIGHICYNMPETPTENLQPPAPNPYEKIPLILFIDDNPVDRAYVDKILTRNGFKVILAEDGPDGVKMAHKEIPDLILLDILLPKVSGIEISKQIKEDPAIAHIPVVFFTTLDAPRGFVNFSDYGAVGFIPKSISTVDLIRQIKLALNRNPKLHD